MYMVMLMGHSAPKHTIRSIHLYTDIDWTFNSFRVAIEYVNTCLETCPFSSLRADAAYLAYADLCYLIRKQSSTRAPCVASQNPFLATHLTTSIGRQCSFMTLVPSGVPIGQLSNYPCTSSSPVHSAALTSYCPYILVSTIHAAVVTHFSSNIL